MKASIGSEHTLVSRKHQNPVRILRAQKCPGPLSRLPFQCSSTLGYLGLSWYRLWHHSAPWSNAETKTRLQCVTGSVKFPRQPLSTAENTLCPERRKPERVAWNQQQVQLGNSVAMEEPRLRRKFMGRSKPRVYSKSEIRQWTMCRMTDRMTHGN